jgi:hypothetical protein
MDFEEFFRKKKINLVSFEQGEPALFSEFKIHYEQMGEKSFDHTKKYWFNKLRLRFPAPPEVKVEKVTIENTLAEQTVTESLIESASPPPNIGFKPKFRAAVTKPAESTPNTEPAPIPEKKAESTEQPVPPAALGFKPKFKAGVTKTVESAAKQKEEPKEDESPATEQSAENSETKPAYKPRFNMKNIKPKEEE